MTYSLEERRETKRRMDEEKIQKRASQFEHIYDKDEWRPWTGNNYIKSWYDVMLPDGTVIEHFWPNAGNLNHYRGQYVFDENRSDIKVRLSSIDPY